MGCSEKSQSCSSGEPEENPELKASADETRRALADAEASRSEAEKSLKDAKAAQEDALAARQKAEEETQNAIEADQKARETEAEAREKSRATEAEQTHVVDTLKDALSNLATGDLCKEIETALPDHYEDLRRDFNNAVQTLRDAMRLLIRMRKPSSRTSIRLRMQPTLWPNVPRHKPRRWRKPRRPFRRLLTTPQVQPRARSKPTML